MKTHLPKHTHRSHRARGFTLLEAIVTLAVMTTISSVAIFFATNIFQNSRTAKLTAQVVSLNQALRVYQANGGNLPASPTAQTVLAKLKTTSSNGEVIAGVRGSMIDPRLLAVESETGTGPRAFWNDAKKRFALKEDGRGIFEFALSDEAGAADYGSETRTANLKLAQKDAWVWDYKDFDRGTGGTGGFPLDPDGSGGSTPPGGGGSTGGLSKLLPPVFSLRSGAYDTATLATLTLTHPNPPGSGTLYYSLDSGSTWTEYTGTLTVPSWPATIVAYVDSRNDNRWLDSDLTLETYNLPPLPEIAFYTTVELINY